MSSKFENGMVRLCQIPEFKRRVLQRVQGVQPDRVSGGSCLDLTVIGLIPESVFIDAIVLFVEGTHGTTARVYRVHTEVGHIRLFLRSRKSFEDDELDPLPPGVYIWMESFERYFPRTAA